MFTLLLEIHVHVNLGHCKHDKCCQLNWRMNINKQELFFLNSKKCYVYIAMSTVHWTQAKIRDQLFWKKGVILT